MTRGSKKKYVYIKLSDGRYVKARVMLQGREEPVIETAMEPSKIIIVGRPTTKVPFGYKVFGEEDLPLEVREALKKL